MCISTEIQRNALVKFVKANGPGMHNQEARVISITAAQVLMLFDTLVRVDDSCFYYFVDADFAVMAIFDLELDELRILDEAGFNKIVKKITEWLLSE